MTHDKENAKKRSNRWWKTAVTRYLRKHFKMVIAIGGIIVSLALAAKDRVQVKLTEFSANVDAAETFFRLAELQKAEIGRIDNLRTTVHFLHTRIQGVVVSPDQAELYALGDAYVDSFQNMSDSVSNAERFLSLLPPNEMTKQRQTLNSVRTQLSDLTEKAHQLRVKAASHGQLDRDEVVDLDAMSEILRMEIRGISKRTFEALAQRKLYYQRRYLLASWLSYVFIILGFMLSLTGHLAGRDGELPELKL